MDLFIAIAGIVASFSLGFIISSSIEYNHTKQCLKEVEDSYRETLREAFGLLYDAYDIKDMTSSTSWQDECEEFLKRNNQL